MARKRMSRFNANEFYRVVVSIRDSLTDVVAHMDALELKNGKDGLWVTRPWYKSGEETDIKYPRTLRAI